MLDTHNAVRSRFLSANIPYDDIDPEVIDIIDIFNFTLNLPTQFSCFGHEHNGHDDFLIIFHASVTDQNVQDLMEKLIKHSPTGYFGCFHKWLRNHNGVAINNWMFLGGFFQTVPQRIEFIKEICDALRQIGE